ncbi:hypothetical protein, partial [Nostoc sp.]|uniref:hypothetical protein n=1 Tax=Nostoc sp. TaxID=1180 RepID=UPI002FFC57D7
MAFRYILKSGDVIEADTAGEIQQLRNLLNQKPPQLELEQSSFTDLVSLEEPSFVIDAGKVQPEAKETITSSSALEGSNAVNSVVNNILTEPKSPINESSAIRFTGSKVPSVDDFCSLWDKLRRETYKEVLRMLANNDYNELTVSELERCIGQGCKGAMNGIGRLFYGVTGLTWKDYVVLNSSKRTYEVNKIAHQNLVRALEILEPKP